MTDLSKLSSKELEALLEAKKKEEHQRALDKRAAYEGIRAELVQKVENKVRAVCGEVRGCTTFAWMKSGRSKTCWRSTGN